MPRAISFNVQFAISRSICCSTSLSPYFRLEALRHDELMRNYTFHRAFSLENNSLSGIKLDLKACNSFDAAVDMIPVDV